MRCPLEYTRQQDLRAAVLAAAVAAKPCAVWGHADGFYTFDRPEDMPTAIVLKQLTYAEVGLMAVDMPCRLHVTRCLQALEVSGARPEIIHPEAINVMQ